MTQPVEIPVRTQLLKIVDELAQIQKSMDGVQGNLKKTADSIADDINETTDKTKKGLDGFGLAAKKVLNSLKEDFKALASVASIGAGLKISSTMGGVVKDTVRVSDTVRKLSEVFKIANKDQAAFVSSLTKGLGAVGLGSEAAANALEGLKETQVRGTGNLVGYSRAAGELASVSGQAGQEGAIAKALADVVQARGRNVNDPAQMQAIAEAVNRTRGATGKGATDILGSMRDLLATANDNQKRLLTPTNLSNLAIASAAGGPGATTIIQRYLRGNQYDNAALKALGVDKLFGANGVNSSALRQYVDQAKGLGGGDVNAGLRIRGLTDDEAAGLKLLYDNLSLVEKATKEAAESTKSLADSYEDSKTLTEAFKSNFERLKSMFSGAVSYSTGHLTDFFKTTAKSNIGAGSVAVGSALLAATLTRKGLGGIGSALGLKSAQEQLLESKGEKVTPVRVVNVAEFPGGGGALGAAAAAGGVAGKLGKAAGAISALGIGVELGDALRSTDIGGKVSDAIADAVLNGLKKVGVGYGAPQAPANARVPTHRVQIEVRDRNHDLKRVLHQGSGPNMGSP